MKSADTKVSPPASAEKPMTEETPAQNEAAIRRLLRDLRSGFPVTPAITALDVQREHDGDCFALGDTDPHLVCMDCKETCLPEDFPSAEGMICTLCIAEKRDYVRSVLS